MIKQICSVTLTISMSIRYTSQFVFTVAVLMLFLIGNGWCAEFYVSPSGSSSGTGSQTAPWDLRTALNHPSAVQPGDTIYLRGGTYNGPFRSFLTGNASQKIVLRSFPGESAILDNPTNSAIAGWSPGASPTLMVSGSHGRYERLTIINSSTQRNFGTSYSSCYPSCLGDGVNDMGNGNQVIHNVIRDVGIGITSQGSAGDGSLYYGNIMYFIGWEETGSLAPNANSRGHAFYVQNRCSGGRKVLENNIDFWSYTYSQQIYGSSGADVDCIDSVGNIIYENGLIGTSLHGAGLLLGGNAAASDLRVHNNIVFSRPDCSIHSRFDAIRPAYLIAPNPLSVRDNYFRGCDAIDYNLSIPNLTRSGNIFVGGLGGSPSLVQTQFAGDTFLALSADSQVRITERWSSFDPTWGYLAIVNGAGGSTVSWTPAQCGLGDSIELREMMNHTGEPVHVFRCDGSAKSISMDYSGAIIAPLGAHARAPTLPTRDFRLFLLTKRRAPGAPSGLVVQ